MSDKNIEQKADSIYSYPEKKNENTGREVGVVIKDGLRVDRISKNVGNSIGNINTCAEGQ